MSGNNHRVLEPSRPACGSALSSLFAIVALVCALTGFASQSARADETGVSFWLPGTFGSLAAAPGQPGFSFATSFYHTTVDAEKGTNFQQGGRIEAGLDSRANLYLLSPNYVFPTPILNGQFAVGVTSILGPVDTGISATLAGPRGNTISGARNDSLTSAGDLYPLMTMKWNKGVHNFMTYASGDIPVGDYDPARLANIGIGHGAIDGGAGYTYFNPAAGYEFSTVAGLTYNFENPTTRYRSGVDFHADWAASKFFTKQLFAGLVGYGYDEVGCDSGPGDRLGCFQSRVVGLGPQIGYLFPMGDMQGYANVKAYGEFDAKNRPDGFNVWLTFAVAPAAPSPHFSRGMMVGQPESWFA
jgi:hypothetical protein